MFDAASFTACIRDNLKARGFGHKRIKQLTDDFEARMKAHVEDGKDAGAAGMFAMKDVFENVSREAQERAKRTASMLAQQGDNIKLVTEGENAPVSKFLMDGKRGSKGTAVARAAVSKLEHDPRFSGVSYATAKEVVRGQLYSLFNDTLETVGKGAFGRQKGKAHLPNIAREVMGQSTGDASAKAVADAWLKIADLTVDMMNAAGGTMNKLARYLPQSQNAVRVAKGGEGAWVRMHLDELDWNKTRWPDGTMIKPEERIDVLKAVYATMVSDGASKIDVGAFRGRGRAVGNLINDHRFMHYKSADSWLKVHEAYGDGNPFDVMVRHIENMSHKIALVQTFGANPEMTAMNLTSIVRKVASRFGGRELADAEAILKNKFEPMFETVMRQNPMDPHSTTGALVTGTANILTSAQLGSASFLAIPGDFMQTVAVRSLNNMGLFDGVKTYLNALIADPLRSIGSGKNFQSVIANQSGFVMDQAVMATYAASRWTGVATAGPALSRHLSEATMRLSLMAGHTRAARWTVQSEFMGMLDRARGTAFEDLPFRALMERYGISADEWNAMRAVPAWEPRTGVKFLRPIDVLKSDVPNRDALFRKFQGMIYDEGKQMVPESTIEGGVALKSTTRPDTLAGMLLYSFSMYKNFPISFMMIYGRLGMMAPKVAGSKTAGRVAFYAGLGAGMTLVGALGTQLRELSRGRDPLPMDSPEFLGKAFLSGGALSIWGDFLFNGINEYGAGPGEVAAGPMIQFAGDTINLTVGNVFEFMQGQESKVGAESVEFARRYTPGTSIWWARLMLERNVFDKLQELADPKARSKWKRRESTQKKERGNAYWWGPGQDEASRAPQFEG
jgi:hypothetical protein